MMYTNFLGGRLLCRHFEFVCIPCQEKGWPKISALEPDNVVQKLGLRNISMLSRSSDFVHQF